MALELVKLIADIENRPEDKKRTDAEFALVSRRDCDPSVCYKIIAEAGRAFKRTHWIKGRRFGRGWPQGCNDLWQDGMTSLSVMEKNGRLDVSGVLTFEADCIPLRPDWIDRLIHEWANREPGIECVGHLHEEGLNNTHAHINGNAMFDPLITRSHPELTGSDGIAGWDCFHAKTLLRIGRDTNFIFQIYKAKGMTAEDVVAIRKGGVIPSLFHGIKGDGGIKIVREMIESGEFFRDPDAAGEQSGEHESHGDTTGQEDIQAEESKQEPPEPQQEPEPAAATDQPEKPEAKAKTAAIKAKSK